MPQSFVRCCRTVALALVFLAPIASAQDGATRVTFTVSPGFITFSGFGGSFGTAVARLSVSRDFSRYAGAEVALFTVTPMGGASAQPGCVAGSSCQARTTPNALNGVMLSGYAFAGQTPLRLIAGVGAVKATGGEGFDPRSTTAGMVGLEWVSRSTRWFAPTFGVRFAQLGSPIAGARQLFLPGVGLSF